MPFDPIRRAIAAHPHAPLRQEDVREAAVALVLRPTAAGGLPELLMIKRAEHPGDPWSGHMAFPGGRRDPEDADPLATALRETREELGLDLSGATRLGPLSPIRTPRVRTHIPALRVYSYTFGLPELPPLYPNDEVDSVHWFGVDRLLSNEGRATFPYTWRGEPLTMPCVRLDGCFIWGLSLRMIDDLLARMRREGLG
ncbi:MAG: CoA pyrophosphatase [Alphaproteobacteria bacterium]|nr:CoA pyrophosphatase [Alphaproteobacteria bacterium]